MGNLIANASALDGVEDWTGATSVDEATIGAEGRAVLVSSTGSIRSDPVGVTAGATIDAGGLVAGGALSVEFLTGGGGAVSTALLPVRLSGDGNPRRGLAGSFDVARGRLVVPGGAAQARVRANGGGTVYLLRPRLETALPARERHLWQAGPHSNPDLNLPAFPIDFPTARQFDADPISTRGSFAGDSGVPITRRKFRTRRYLAKLSYVVNAEELDRLLLFFDQTDGPFWFTRPETFELCRAYWQAEEPKPGGLIRGQRTVEFSLLLEVS